jgi:hypothetical protein
VYLLEHGLADAELKALFSLTRFNLDRSHGVDLSFWRSYPLPLLVAVTEIGYIYRGTGTDFWPIFAERLGDIPLVHRSEISDLFRQATARFGLAKPSETPWNRAFCHIAWPILHAILPIELQRPLARVMRDVRQRLDLNGNDADLIKQIRSRANLMGSGRLLAWLDDQQTAAAVVRQILEPGQRHAIADSALQRIATDLANDEEARTALRDARNRQKSLAAKPARRSREQNPESEIRFAQLVLQSTGQGLLLALKIPQLEATAREVARSAVEAMRWRAFLWGQGRPVPGRSIFSDYPLPLTVPSLPTANEALISDAENLPLTQDVRDFLGSIRVNTTTPIVFSEFSADGNAFQQFPKTLAEDSECIVLVSDEEPPASTTLLGKIAALRAYRFEVKQPDNAVWIGKHGLSLRKSAHLIFVGDPEIEQHRPRRRFMLHSYVAFEVGAAESECEVHLTLPDGSESHISGSDRILVGLSPNQIGTYEVRYGADERVTFDVTSPSHDADLITVDIDAGPSTIEELTEKQVGLRFQSENSLQELTVELRLHCDGREHSRVTQILPDTPCHIRPDDVIWDSLLTGAVTEQLLLSKEVELRVVVKGLIDASFRFEQVTSPFAWHRDVTGNLTASDESSELAIFAMSSQRPLTITPALNYSTETQITLYRAGHKTPLLSGGLCTGPKVWHPSPQEMARMPSRLLRQFEYRRGDTADAQSIVEALLTWSAAAVDQPVTQMRRGWVVAEIDRWLVRQLCGAKWADLESNICPRRETTFASAFLRESAKQRIGYADAGLTRTESALLDRILLRLMETSGLTDQLQRIEVRVDQEIGAALDDLFNDAYSALHRELTSLGGSCPFDPQEDIDVGETFEDWESVRSVAVSETMLPQLVQLLRPLEAGDELSSADFALMLPDDVIDFLHYWIMANAPSHHARTWNRDLIETSYWLFAKPSVAVRLHWRGATHQLLADGFSARAIRYAALRTVPRNRVSV